MIKYDETRRTAKVIYVVSGLEEMVIYLNAKVERGDISEEDSDEIIEFISAVYANVTVDELNKIRNMF